MKIVTFISDEQDKLAPPEDIEKPVSYTHLTLPTT